MKYLNFIYLKNIMGLGAESGEIRYDFNKSVNVIFGSNGTGKSRLLKAIRTFFSDRIQVAWLRTDDKGNSEMEMYLDDEIKNETLKVLESKRYVKGQESREFEREFADFCNTKYGTATNSGTSALYVTLSTFIVYVSSSTSAKTGFAPVWIIGEAVAMKVCEGITTSSPLPIPIVNKAT